jgi:hypothetical protein
MAPSSAVVRAVVNSQTHAPVLERIDHSPGTPGVLVAFAFHSTSLALALALNGGPRTDKNSAWNAISPSPTAV